MPSRPVLIGRTLATQTLNRAYKATRGKQSTTQQTPTNTQQHTRHTTARTTTPDQQQGEQWSTRVTAAIAKGERPGPIPNPEVKPSSADGTATERLWESRTPPDIHSSAGATAKRWPLRSFDAAPRAAQQQEQIVVADPAWQPASLGYGPRRGGRPTGGKPTGGRPTGGKPTSGQAVRWQAVGEPEAVGEVGRAVPALEPGHRALRPARQQERPAGEGRRPPGSARATGSGPVDKQRAAHRGPGAVRRSGRSPEDITGAELPPFGRRPSSRPSPRSSPSGSVATSRRPAP